ncbi:MAG: aldehyde dehydrogenase [Ruminiclostridium sp.]|jgi:aldehyde dehydrogenase (NAD+)|nr:aldehyde dehydrogenase [Ruminiclostridium sp.]
MSREHIRYIEETVARQRAFFQTGATKPVPKRLAALARLKAEIQAREQQLLNALQADLHKSHFEGYMCELGLNLDELGYLIQKTPQWARPQRRRTPLPQYVSKSYQLAEPYGVTLIMSPWNYPYLLSLDPLFGAVAAGNCVVLKPSAYAPHTSRCLAQLIEAVFPPEWVTVVEGGREQNAALLDQRFDYIFFTGSVDVGKMVMEKAAKHLTPVTLELGGKSPVIVDRSANIPLTAKRLAFGKLLNAGQTCVAPDYCLVDRTVKDQLVEELIRQFKKMLGPHPLENPDFVRIINRKHFNRLQGLLEGEAVLWGGGHREDPDHDTGWIAPTLIADTLEAKSKPMGEEIFGPILPILPYDHLDEAIRFIQAREKPLALYLFTRCRRVKERVLHHCSFGGGCINDTIIHLATHHMGFGGVGNSGMGSYHGKRSFDTFSHYRAIVDKATWLDLPMRYHPYNKKINAMLIRMFIH